MTERYRHKKRGTTYQIIGTALVQATTPIPEGTVVTIYQCEQTGAIWVRPTSEFIDGRFEELENPEITSHIQFTKDTELRVVLMIDGDEKYRGYDDSQAFGIAYEHQIKKAAS